MTESERKLSISEKYLLKKVPEVDFNKPQGGLTYQQYSDLSSSDRNRLNRAIKAQSLRNTAKAVDLKSGEGPVTVSSVNSSGTPQRTTTNKDTNYEAGSDLTGQGKRSIIGLDGKTYKPGDDGYNAELMKAKVALNKPVKPVVGSVKVDGKALRAQMESENAASDLNNVIREAVEDQADRGVTGKEEVPNDQVVSEEPATEEEVVAEPVVEQDSTPTEATPEQLRIGEQLKKAGITQDDPTFGDALKTIESLEGTDALKDLIPDFEMTPEMEKLGDNFIKSNTPCPDETGAVDSLAIGFQVVLPNPCQDTTADKQKAHMTNFFDKITGPNKDLVNMSKELKNVSKVISNDMSGYLSKMSGSLNDELGKTISKGFQKVAALHFAKVGAGYPYAQALKDITKTQEALLPAVGGLLDGVFCLNTQIEKILPDMISDLLAAAIPKAVAVPTCLVDEVIGALNFKMVNLFDSFATPKLGPILNILQVGFDVKGFMLGGMDFNLKVGAFSLDLKCPDEVKVECPNSSIFTLGKGLQKGKSILESVKGLKDITKGTAITQAAGAVAGVNKTPFEEEYGIWQSFGSSAAALKKGVNKCTPIAPKCIAPKVEFFGGGGSGADGKIIMGRIVDRFDPKNIFLDIKKTGSIVGVEITNRGSGYIEEPIITLQDNCNQGYGAYGRAHIDHNPQSPTYGQVIDVTILSTGTNYPADAETPLFIERVIIEDPGKGYADDDTLDDFDLDIQDGKIVGGRLKNIITYDDLPKLNINSETGVGAILRPVLSKTRPQGEVVEIIDCVGRYN